MSDVNPGSSLLRFAVAIEGATLLMLVLVAVPLKRVFDIPFATEIMGPIHGLAFLIFLYALAEALSARAIPKRSTIRFLLGAMIPFGGVLNERWLANTIEVRKTDV